MVFLDSVTAISSSGVGECVYALQALWPWRSEKGCGLLKPLCVGNPPYQKMRSTSGPARMRTQRLIKLLRHLTTVPPYIDMAFSRYPTTRINGGLITRVQHAEVQCVMEAFLVCFKIFLHFCISVFGTQSGTAEAWPINMLSWLPMMFKTASREGHVYP